MSQEQDRQEQERKLDLESKIWDSIGQKDRSIYDTEEMYAHETPERSLLSRVITGVEDTSQNIADYMRIAPGYTLATGFYASLAVGTSLIGGWIMGGVFGLCSILEGFTARQQVRKYRSIRERLATKGFDEWYLNDIWKSEDRRPIKAALKDTGYLTEFRDAFPGRL